MRDSRRRALERAADNYVQATERAKAARDRLVAEVRAAHREGVPPADIRRAARQVWTRAYLHKLLTPGDREAPPR